MITLKNSAGTPDGRLLMTGSRSSESRRAGKGALWFESSVQKLEDQEGQIVLVPDPPSERFRKEPPAEGSPDEGAEKRSK